MFTGVSPEQKVAAAVLLHHLGPGEARQFAEAIRAVDDGVAAVALGVTQQEVTVCSKKNRKNGVKHNEGSKIKRRTSGIFQQNHVLVVLGFSLH